MTVQIYRYSRTTGSLIGQYSGPILSLDSTARLYGGCDQATIETPYEFGEPFPFVANEEIQITQNGQPLFAGIVSETEPDSGGNKIVTRLDGWFRVLDSLQVVPIPGDRLGFGVTAPVDSPRPQLFYPAISTVRGVIEWLAANVIAPQTNNRIALGETIWAPVTCHLNGEFSVYANDKLGKVLETLAQMDDLVIGVSADRKLYARHRGTLESGALFFAAQLSGDVKSALQAGNGMAIDARLKITDQAPTHVAVFGRDADGFQAVRVYQDITEGVESRPAKRVNIPARNIRSGPQARRLARGTLRRYSALPFEWHATKVYFAASQRLEPHLGTIRMQDGDGTEFTTALASALKTAWLPFIQTTITMGETDADPGQGGPNDPLDSGPPLDDPAIDTGTGTELLPDPSSRIDLNDGFDGDGDGLHYGGPLTVDYGTDLADHSNRPQGSSATSPSDLSGLQGLIWRGRVDALDLTGPTPSYRVTLFRADGEPCSLPGNTEATGDPPQVPPGVFDGCIAYPAPAGTLQVDDHIWAAFVPLDSGPPFGLISDTGPTLRKRVMAAGNPVPGVSFRFRELAGGRKTFVQTDADGYATARVNPGFVQVSAIAWPYQETPELVDGVFSETVTAAGTGTTTLDDLVVAIQAGNAPTSAPEISAFQSAPFIIGFLSSGTQETEYPLGRMLHGPEELWGGVRD